MADKVRENRLRRMAKRQRVIIHKSRTRDPRAADFEGFMLTDADTNTAILGSSPFAYSASLDDIETWLTRD